MNIQGFRRQLMTSWHEYEGYLMQVEGKLLALRARMDRARGGAADRLSPVVTDLEHEIEEIKAAGLQALERLGHAAELGKAGLERVKTQLAGEETTPASLLLKGKEAVHKAAIEAKALRHGVKVGLRVARRVSKRVKTTKS